MSEFKETLKQFYFSHPNDWLDSILTRLDDCPVWAREIFETFTTNLEATANVASVPFLMAHASINNAQFQKIYISERIRSLAADNEQHDPLKIAIERRQQQIETGETLNHDRDETLRFLKSSQENPEFARAASELLSEALVMIWGAFEAFISEYVRILLNETPHEAINLLANDVTKKYFPSRIFSIDSLTTHNFNFTTSMGDVIFADRHLDSLPMIKDIISTLSVSSPRLISALNNDQLWILWQRRHLIVHKRGTVDQTYLRKTNEKLELGSRLKISSRQLEEAFKVVISTVSGILDTKR